MMTDSAPTRKTKAAATRLGPLLEEVRTCRLCAAHLPLGPRPVVQAHRSARVMIVGQAPGTKVHATGVPFNDPSGDKLREWLGIGRETFYDATRIALVPAGFCYPGRKGGGDAPPRPECAPHWHPRLRAAMPGIALTVLAGAYAQAYYLNGARGRTLAETVRNWRDFLPEFLPIPHPSPRNRLWLRRNPWFEAEVVPELRARVHALIG